jgi:D-arabinose 5-phosphate isomerase GutQ
MNNPSQDERLREEMKPLERLLAKGMITQQEFEAAKNKILGGEPGVFCTGCGASNSQGARFCFNCGTRLVVMGTAPPEARDDIET